MSTVKEEVRALLDELPDECPLEAVQYHLYVSCSVPGRKGLLVRMR